MVYKSQSYCIKGKSTKHTALHILAKLLFVSSITASLRDCLLQSFYVTDEEVESQMVDLPKIK